MKRLHTTLAALSALGLLLAPALAHAKAPPSASADPALWVVKDKDTTIYLFGSVHVLKPGTIWFDDEVKAAFDRSDTLMLEMVEPTQEEMSREIGQLGAAPEGPALSQKLTPEARVKYVAAMEGASLPWQAFERFQPWMAAVSLSVSPLARLGYDTQSGVEKILTDAAKAEGKTVGGLETSTQQLGYFAGLPQDQQILFLNQTVDELPQAEGEFARLVDDWKAGKPDALAKEMNESMEASPQLAQVLLYGRNANWAKWIAARMQTPGTLFIAVGAGHLAGAKSVQDQLKALGYQSRRLGKKDFGLR
ncbi:TraB/GumN family protein [soil metagenome]